MVLLILAPAFLAFGWAAVAVTNQWGNWTARLALCLMTMATFTVVSCTVLIWSLSLESSVERALEWAIWLALAVEVAPFIISLVINRSMD